MGNASFLWGIFKFMSRKPYINASEIGTYLYCRRAWALRKLGVESTNQKDLERGNEFHHAFGKRERLLQTLCGLIIVILVVLLAVLLRILFK